MALDVTSYLLGKNSGGGGTPNLQAKTVEITENGTTNVSADTGYDGLSNVGITTNVQPNLESKSVTITENTTTTITPTQGKDGLSSVSVTTNVASGGVSAKDVNFYDYDGTIINSYTKAEFLELSALPTNPSHSGLTSQGWNWTLTNAKNHVTKYNKLNVGQIYIPNDGSTRFYLELNIERLSPILGFAVNGTATIDWGDGNTDTVTGTSTSTLIQTPHTYATQGNYVISISSESKIFFSGENNASLIFNKVCYKDCVKKAEIGNASLGSYSFCDFYFLKTIILSNYVQNLGTYVFLNVKNLAFLIIPDGVTTLPAYGFGNSVLNTVVLPKSCTYISQQAFNNCKTLQNIIFSDGTTDILSYCFNGTSLSTLILPDSITNIETSTFSGCPVTELNMSNGIRTLSSNAFSNCTSLVHIKMSSKISYISTNAFSNCTSALYYDFRDSTSIPTLQTTNAFNNIPDDCKIIVPDNLYENWIAAGNWNTYSSNIIKASDWA